jgi:hypothetical protein
MTLSGVTWAGPTIDDLELIQRLPRDLAVLLRAKNGFILHSGTLHVRGASKKPGWHSLRHAWEGANSLSGLYSDILATDVPFAEDMLGDQFLLREGLVVKLDAETGEVEKKEDSLRSFFEKVDQDIEGYLNLSFEHKIEPGELLLAFPPFCLKESAGGSKMKACPAAKVIGFHADLARQIRSVPDGGKIEFKWTP